MHTFFNNCSLSTLARMRSAQRLYDLQLRPNSISDVLEAEMDHDGTVVAARFPAGLSLRRHASFVIVHTPAAAWFIDRWGLTHPFD